MTDRTLGTIALLACVLVAGCGGIIQSDNPAGPPGDDPAAPPDPDSDVIGWEDGYWHNETITVDQADGLNETELRAFVARSMARVELIRDREFKSRVPVSVMSREDFRARQGAADGGTQAARAWNEQVWEGIWLVGEERSVQEALSTARGSSVAGFYSPSREEITIITPNPDRPRIDNGTLVHELVHALQDQYDELSSPALAAQTQDAQLATDSLVEGEANYIEDRYAARCGSDWRCVPSVDRGSGGGLPENFNFGVYTTLFFPYSDGPVWVADQVSDEGWSAVTDAFSDPPVSSEQIIHQSTDTPIPLSVRDTSSDSWSRYPSQGIDGADTVGEASIYAMFWYQSRTYDADAIDPQSIGRVSGPYDVYNYSSPPSAGWGNDKLIPYHAEDGRGGYVWVTAWDTPADASEFHRAYRAILQAHEARTLGNGTYLVEDGPFADAFRITRNGTRVTIVNGPDTDALSEIRPRQEPGEPLPTTSTGDDGPGFGMITVIIAVCSGGVAMRAYRRRS